jgi:hypothetical protein
MKLLRTSKGNIQYIYNNYANGFLKSHPVSEEVHVDTQKLTLQPSDMYKVHTE